MNKINNKKLNVPAWLIHKKDGKKYSIPGKLVSINQMNESAVMSFNIKGKVVEHEVPIKNVVINEGFLDTIKDTASKVGKSISNAIDFVVKKIKGMLFPVINGIFIKNTSAANIATQCDDNGVVKGTGCVQMFLHPDVAQNAKVDGINPVVANIDSTTLLSEEDDIKIIEAYWNGAIEAAKKGVKNGETITESVRRYARGVNKTLLENHKKHNKASKLYEEGQNGLIYSLKSQKSDGIVNLNTKQVIEWVKASYMSQINDTSMYSPYINQFNRQVMRPKMNIKSDFQEGRGSVLFIYGAPGIGKTSILKNVTKELRKESSVKMSTLVVNCSGLKNDKFELPAYNYNADGKPVSVTQLPADWLPVYITQPEKKVKIKSNIASQNYLEMPYDFLMDFFINSHSTKQFEEYLADGKIDVYGGLLFLDEISRTPSDSQNIIMSIFSDKTVGSTSAVLASNWGVVVAANRGYDMSADNAEFWNNEPAMKSRFQYVNYVPTRAEWLSWARSKNEKGQQNISEYICKFIEEKGDAVWYECVEFGSYDHMSDTIKNTRTQNGGITNQDVADLRSDEDFEKIAQRKTTYNPRVWEQISQEFSAKLEAVLPLEGEDVENIVGASSKVFKDYAKAESNDEDVFNMSIISHLKELDPELKNAIANNSSDANEEKDKAWREFYDAHKSALDTEGMCADGSYYARYMFVKKWLAYELIPSKAGANSLPEKEMKTYIMTDGIGIDGIKNIWENGNIGEDFDDYSASNLDDVNDSIRNKMSWKTKQGLVNNIYQTILSYYGGNDNPSDAKKQLQTELYDFVQELYNIHMSYDNLENLVNNLSDSDIDKIIDMYFTKMVDKKKNKKVQFLKPQFIKSILNDFKNNINNPNPCARLFTNNGIYDFNKDGQNGDYNINKICLDKSLDITELFKFLQNYVNTKFTDDEVTYKTPSGETKTTTQRKLKMARFSKGINCLTKVIPLDGDTFYYDEERAEQYKTKQYNWYQHISSEATVLVIFNLLKNKNPFVVHVTNFLMYCAKIAAQTNQNRAFSLAYNLTIGVTDVARTFDNEGNVSVDWHATARNKTKNTIFNNIIKQDNKINDMYKQNDFINLYSMWINGLYLPVKNTLNGQETFDGIYKDSPFYYHLKQAIEGGDASESVPENVSAPAESDATSANTTSTDTTSANNTSSQSSTDTTQLMEFFKKIKKIANSSELTRVAEIVCDTLSDGQLHSNAELKGIIADELGPDVWTSFDSNGNTKMKATTSGLIQKNSRGWQLA